MLRVVRLGPAANKEGQRTARAKLLQLTEVTAAHRRTERLTGWNEKGGGGGGGGRALVGGTHPRTLMGSHPRRTNFEGWGSLGRGLRGGE